MSLKRNINTRNKIATRLSIPFYFFKVLAFDIPWLRGWNFIWIYFPNPSINAGSLKKNSCPLCQILRVLHARIRFFFFFSFYTTSVHTYIHIYIYIYIFLIFHMLSLFRYTCDVNLHSTSILQYTLQFFFFFSKTNHTNSANITKSCNPIEKKIFIL